MKRFLLWMIAAGQCLLSYTQAPVSWTSSDMYLAIRKLNVLGSVLYVAAHPDDENTRLITYFSKEKMYRAGYLSITRGDGGQNLIGEEQGIELGLIRTQELLAARRIDGGEQFFTRAFDFGYSKNPEETFQKWDKEKILSDVVWVIRKFQPDVIITRFPTTGEGGHGHHTASAILANEAFTAAADKNRFPEQLQYVQPWQAKRILWNTFNFGGNNQTSPDQFKFDVGDYNPLLGKSYGEIAAASRSQHKSQGFGVPTSRGEAFEFFRTTGGPAPENDIMDAVTTNWNRIPGGEKISKKIDAIASGFDLLHPERSVKALVELYRAMKTLPDGYWKKIKMHEVQQLIEQCSGLWLDIYTQDQYAVQTDSVRFNFQFNNRLGVNATVKKIQVDDFDSTVNLLLTKNKNLGFPKTIYVPSSKPITQPYWLEKKMEEGYYNVTDQQMIGVPDIQPSYLVNLTLNIEGEEFHFSKPVKYKFTDPVKGELYWPLVVISPVIVNPAEEIKIFTGETERVTGNISLKGMKNGFSGNMKTFIDGVEDDDQVLSFKPQQVYFASKDRNIDVTYSKKAEKKSNNMITAVINENDARTYMMNKREIIYDHIPALIYFKDAEIKMRYVDVKTSGKKIAYIVGAGDKVPEALEQMGYEVNRLTEKEISKNDLDKFDAIITGVRAYNTVDWLDNHYDKLMKYVENGGNLIVQYNTSNFLSSVSSRIGPYPFTISRNRVTDENSPVSFLQPDHPVLNFPNKITQDDFKGWIQERSVYDAIDTSGKFEKILAMNDPGEKPDEGSLLIAKYGKGYFTYMGLVFFRQLPAGVPGAYRLLANLIALNKKKAF